ncbi:MAG: hypothetical protein MZU97_00310 [Bacillus subtilis]|nr:hypothetical protein [Bacillus subtilis]
MNGSNRKTLGVIFIVLGALFVLQLSGVINQIFFAGWWTLFLIVPALVHIIKHGIQTGNMVLFGLGNVLPLGRTGLQSFRIFASDRIHRDWNWHFVPEPLTDIDESHNEKNDERSSFF